MLLANLDGHRIYAEPGIARATCPTCGVAVIPKCGRINVWHWAHKSGTDCDPWAERDSAWHLAWQNSVPPERREVVFGVHRADMVSAGGIVIEVQHSGLSVDDIEAREAFYPRMIWVFDAVEAATLDEGYGPRLDIRKKADNPAPNFRTFRWKHARKSIASCRSAVWLDIGNDEVLKLGKLYPGPPCGGWGHLHQRQALVDAINKPPSGS